MVGRPNHNTAVDTCILINFRVSGSVVELNPGVWSLSPMDKQVTMVMRKNMELVLIREGKLSEIEARAGRHILGSFIT